jgi:Glycosyl hydrolase family 12.
MLGPGKPDIWVKAPTGNTRIELMVWMYTYKTGPISSIVASTKPKIGDFTWTVHYGSNGSNATISLVNTSSTGATANVTSGTIDIKGIMDWLIANNTTTYGQFDNTWTLDQVQWGFEISGDGGATQEFINNCFSVSSS